MEEVHRPPVPVSLEISRSFKEEELEDLMDQRDLEEGRIILRMMEEGLGDKGALNLAHQLFIYGLPEGPRRGVPIRALTKLARLVGVDPKLLKPHIRPWTREAMRMARDASPIYAFACSKEARETHLADLEKMRAGITDIEAAIANATPGTRAWVDLHRLLKDARKEWQDASGITSGVKVSEAAATMQAKALVDSIKEEHSDEGKSSIRNVKGRCFDVD